MTTITPDARALELQSRSLDALVSLLHALDASDDVDDVAGRALLTLSGQLLVRRAAFFVADGEVLRLRATVGIGRNRVTPPEWTLPPTVDARFRASDAGVIDLDTIADELDPEISGSFDRIARLSNGETTVGVVLLGGWLGAREIGEADRQLLRTMGVVIGTTLHRVRVQEELERARRRLEQAQLIRQSVMDHVSHEFNTPLMVVKSIGDLLPGAAPEEWPELLTMHGESVARLEYLVGSILQVAREVENESRTRTETIDRVVRRQIRPWWVQWSQGRSEFVVDPEPGTGRIHTDDARLEMILQALHANALAAREEMWSPIWTNVYVAPVDWWSAQDHVGRLARYGRLDRRTGDPTLGLERPAIADDADRELVVEVVDLGRGIPEADLERVFEPFTLASNSASLGIAGAGMGLPTATRLAAELGGTIELRSHEGIGTVASFRLPVVRDARG